MLGQDSALETGLEEFGKVACEPPQPKQVRFWVIREGGQPELISTPLQEAVAKVRAIVGKWKIEARYSDCK